MINDKMRSEIKILVVLASGIGNSILFSPAMRNLRENFPKAQIDIFAPKPQFAEPFRDSKIVNKIHDFKGIGTLAKIRSERYDYSITAFPSNKWQFNVFPYVMGVKKRITHSYDYGKLKTLSFLQNIRIPANEKLHDVEQNLELVKTFGIKPKKYPVYFHLSKKNIENADKFISSKKLKRDTLIGIHSGAGFLRFKVAPDSEFVKEINKIKAKNKRVLIFGGPEEKEKKEKISKLIKDSIIVDAKLKDTASIIQKCRYFISNDTGLMHIAVAVGVPNIVAFFNGTNPTRTSPYSKNARVVLLSENKMKYPFWSTKANVRER